jgi:glycosyltransferase involved in cell wall biosynthesis
LAQGKLMLITYICPFAHYSGHHPSVCLHETKALKEYSGHDVILVTFQGIIDGHLPAVPMIQVVNAEYRKQRFNQLRQKTLYRWFLMIYETYKTIQLAFSRKSDAYYLRDGDPFLPVVFILRYFNRSKIPLVISMTGSVLFAPKQKSKNLSMLIYRIALKLLHNKMWIPLYRAVLKRGNVTLTCQNKLAYETLNKTLNGVFNGHVKIVERGTDTVIRREFDQSYYREKLGLDTKQPVVLSFGAPHQGKNLDVVFNAVSRFKHLQIVHGGKHSYSLGNNLTELSSKYSLNGRAKIFSNFIPEDEKQTFFNAADVIILSYTKVFSSTTSMLYEAASYGMPIIASDNGVLGETVKKNLMGVVFEAENPDSLYEALDLYFRLHDGVKENMRHNCLEFASKHGLNKWANDLMSVINERS